MAAAAQRKKLLAVGITLTLAPLILWLALPAALFLKMSHLIGTDERLVEAYSFIIGAILQLVAIYFLENARQKPRDFLSTCALSAGVVSVTSVIVFFGAASAVVLRGW
ncbi:MAG TPA: hypothetical protein VEJ38_03640 [Candidatus Acidoferrales bacterium]|nr:hypothetical protein [Candidatus Acidoferrales bacterium]